MKTLKLLFLVALVASISSAGSAQSGSFVAKPDNPGLDSLFGCGAAAWDGDGNAVGPGCFLGTTNDVALKFYSKGVERMRLTPNGKIGIGTTVPEAFVHIYEDNPLACLRVHSAVADGRSTLEFWSGALGTPDRWRPGYLISDGNSNFRGELKLVVNGAGAGQKTGTVVAMQMHHRAAQIHPALGLGMAPASGDQLSVAGRATVRGDLIVDDRIGIGTRSFADGGQAYRLSVDGWIRARAARVYPSWADHVFDEDYALMPLAEVAEYIAANGHLPKVPSAGEVAREGIDVGATEALLLEKIEELTLHLIRLEKENRELARRIERVER